jgi:hypothetical protein
MDNKVKKIAVIFLALIAFSLAVIQLNLNHSLSSLKDELNSIQKLERRQDKIRKLLIDLIAKKASNPIDYEDQIMEYKALSDSINKYDNELTEYGYRKDNSQILFLIQSKIDKLTTQKRKAENEQKRIQGRKLENQLINQNNHIGEILVSRKFQNQSNGLRTYLTFEADEGYHGRTGAAILWNNVVDCKYVYTYHINGNEIKVDFFKSTCGAFSKDNTFIYDEDSKTLNCYIEGRKFVFY